MIPNEEQIKSSPKGDPHVNQPLMQKDTEQNQNQVLPPNSHQSSTALFNFLNAYEGRSSVKLTDFLYSYTMEKRNTIIPISTDPKNIMNQEFKEEKQEILNEKLNAPRTETNLHLSSLRHRELESLVNTFAMFVCITMENDSTEQNDLLRQTLSAIEANIPNLQSIGIGHHGILVIVFIQEITREENFKRLFPNLDYIPNSNSRQQYSLSTVLSSSGMKYLDRSPNLKQYCCNVFQFQTGVVSESLAVMVTHRQEMPKLEAIKCFYMGYCNDLKKSLENDGFYFSVMLENGVLPERSSLARMAIAASNYNVSPSENPYFAICPWIEPISEGLFCNISKYEIIHTNIYDMNFNDLSSRCDLNNKFHLVKVNSRVESILVDYFSDIMIDQIIAYHNERLGFYIINSPKNIDRLRTLYLPLAEGTYKSAHEPWGKLLEQSVEKKAANIAMIISLLEYFFSCGNCGIVNIFARILNLLHVFSTFVSFAFPGLCSIVIFCVFDEAFNIKDERACVFFTVLYAILVIMTTVFAAIVRQPSDLSVIFFIFSIVFSVFYLFILACAIIAIHYVRTTTDSVSSYEFNVAAFVAIIVLNIVLGIIPMLWRYDKIFQNVGKMFLYLLLGSQNSSSVYLINAIVNTPSVFGDVREGNLQISGEKLSNRKAIGIIIFVLTNSFFGYLIFFLVNRTARVNAVLVLAIIFTIYNGIKIICIITTLIKQTCFEKKIMDENIVKKVKSHIESMYTYTNILDQKEINSQKVNPSDIKGSNSAPATNEERERNIQTRDQMNAAVESKRSLKYYQDTNEPPEKSSHSNDAIVDPAAKPMTNTPIINNPTITSVAPTLTRTKKKVIGSTETPLSSANVNVNENENDNVNVNVNVNANANANANTNQVATNEAVDGRSEMKKQNNFFNK